MKYFYVMILGLGLAFSLKAQPQNNPCLQASAFRIVVLGSSTAAGAGASRADSAWVGRYRRYLQSINPQNEVINLAVGGFVTYRIMPDFFVPPASRPLPDTAHNISKALSLSPDALIINLPSNDRQYPMQEQLDNFDSLFHYANQNGVPVWICTTQPVNSATSVAYQMAVRDSIFARYGSFALDFWTGIADTATGMIDTSLNADAVHLNDLGHRILFQTVVAHNIPGALLASAPFPDLSVTHFLFDENDRCGDSASTIRVNVTNLGQQAGPFPLHLNIQNALTGQVWSLVDTLQSGLGNCTADTISFFHNMFAGGDFYFTAWVNVAGDTVSLNDTLRVSHSYSGHPELWVQGDTVCAGQSALLRASSDPEDTVFWYDAPVGGNRIGAGGNYLIPTLTADTLLYAQAIRGDLFYKNSLPTLTQSNVNWNGAMFDLVAIDTVNVDSFTFKAADPGSQGVEVFYKPGSHIGSEQNAAAWTLLGQAVVNVTTAGTFVTAPIGGLAIPAGDTFGIYIQLQNSNARLAYQSSGSPASFSSPELHLLAGSGSSHNFSGSFYPRHWNGTVHYHFGQKPNGDCQSERMAVPARLDLPPQVDLGRDTLACRQLLLDAGGRSGTLYQWSTGDSSRTLTVDSSGVYWVEVRNSCGRAIDAIFVDIEDDPVAGFSVAEAGLTVALTDQSVASRDYAWDFGDGNFSLLPNPTHTYSRSGTYVITQVVTNSCGEDTLSQTVSLLATDLDSEGERRDMILYPNPVRDVCFVEWKGQSGEKGFLRIVDAMGREVESREVLSGKTEVRMRYLPEGVYFFTLVTRESRYSKAVIRRK